MSDSNSGYWYKPQSGNLNVFPFWPVYGKFDLTTYIQGASDYEIMAMLLKRVNEMIAYLNTINVALFAFGGEHDVYSESDAKYELEYTVDGGSRYITVTPSKIYFADNVVLDLTDETVTKRKVKVPNEDGLFLLVWDNTNGYVDMISPSDVNSGIKILAAYDCYYNESGPDVIELWSSARAGTTWDEFVEESAKLEKAIETEIADRKAADAALQDNIDQEIADRKAAITKEENARKAADTTLQNNIDAEKAARIAADATLTANLNQEISDRKAAITAEENARKAADTTLTNNLNQEISDRKAAITAEENARKAADTTLTNNLNQEITDRKAADATLTNNLNQEITDRKAADDTINESIGTLNTDFTSNNKKQIMSSLGFSTNTVTMAFNSATKYLSGEVSSGVIFSLYSTLNNTPILYTDKYSGSYDATYYAGTVNGVYILYLTKTDTTTKLLWTIDTTEFTKKSTVIVGMVYYNGSSIAEIYNAYKATVTCFNNYLPLTAGINKKLTGALMADKGIYIGDTLNSTSYITRELCHFGSEYSTTYDIYPTVQFDTHLTVINNRASSILSDSHVIYFNDKTNNTKCLALVSDNPGISNPDKSILAIGCSGLGYGNNYCVTIAPYTSNSNVIGLTFGTLILSKGTPDTFSYGNSKCLLKNIRTPIDDNDAATKQYVDDAIASVSGGGVTEDTVNSLISTAKTELKTEIDANTDSINTLNNTILTLAANSEYRGLSWAGEITTNGLKATYRMGDSLVYEKFVLGTDTNTISKVTISKPELEVTNTLSANTNYYFIFTPSSGSTSWATTDPDTSKQVILAYITTDSSTATVQWKVENNTGAQNKYIIEEPRVRVKRTTSTNITQITFANGYMTYFKTYNDGSGVTRTFAYNTVTGLTVNGTDYAENDVIFVYCDENGTMYAENEGNVTTLASDWFTSSGMIPVTVLRIGIDDIISIWWSNDGVYTSDS